MSYNSDSDSPLSSPPASDDEVSVPKIKLSIKSAASKAAPKSSKTASKTTSSKPKTASKTASKASTTKAATTKSKAPAKPASKPAAKSKTAAAKPTPAPKLKQLTLRLPTRSPSPAPRVRHPTPEHTYSLCDSPELAVIVMFRSRFSDAFRGVPNLGCQDIERGIVDSTPSEGVELLLCRLVGLVLNRKKAVERGHHNRALEEAVHAHQSQWPRQWEGKNPMPGGRSFADLDTEGRLILLKALINWALVSSEQIRAIIAENYKGNRTENDLDCPLSVQPWGRDGQKRKYWLIEGQDDTPFRLYRESNIYREDKETTWISIAGTIDEIRVVAAQLEEEDGTPAAVNLKHKIEAAIIRFEDGEKRRQKREYRLTRKALFSQPSGISLYEGRTRGKRIKYTFSDAEDDAGSSFDGGSRSGRSRRESPSVSAISGGDRGERDNEPRYTASGRQIRRPQMGEYGEKKIDAEEIGGNGKPGWSYESYFVDAEGNPVSNGGMNGASGANRAHPLANGGGNEDGDEADDESDWDDSMFLQEGDDKKSLRIILKVNKERLSRTPSVVEALQKEEERRAAEGKKGDDNDGDVEMKDVPPPMEMQNGHSPPARAEPEAAAKAEAPAATEVPVPTAEASKTAEVAMEAA
ncbi:hypothetical protein FPQ18DRAFT_109012 [Pyronema domesticum]|uniref:WHIM1 domain-containing protein n=1 Tax=Pyronema omphalodes (strain CBS 100304) TaxID=1076935 RepID=U4LI85_PYROM|nr:hypothetical protein FPQ18DRAFT_109012 [Pyronema domesticum]CCX12044.1 Similar to hypothetical protein [Tuber melanosporum Mel28]; acc. no. XP_002839234 [Pyronema omphalodes CBS 100304]